jgi:hypothetical protein
MQPFALVSSGNTVILSERDLIARTLRELPRVTETDGSRWVDSELLDKLASILEKRTKACG